MPESAPAVTLEGAIAVSDAYLKKHVQDFSEYYVLEASCGYYYRDLYQRIWKITYANPKLGLQIVVVDMDSIAHIAPIDSGILKRNEETDTIIIEEM